MFDEKKYRACFDEMRAPESMEREILKMTTEKRNKRRFTANAALAFAAVLALLLGLGAVASAAGWFRVEDAVIGSLETGESAPPVIAAQWSEEGADALCLLGVKGSAEYEAAKEWFEYYWGEDYESAAKGEEIWDSTYNQYGAFSQGAIDKLRGISESYGLELMDGKEISNFMDIEVLYYAADCEGLLKGMVDSDVPEGGYPDSISAGAGGHGQYHSGYYYENGTFKLEGEVTLAEGFDKPVCYQLMNCRKGYFANGGYVNIGAWEDCEQWDYTTAEGVTVTIVHSNSRDIVLANLENSVVAINTVDFEEHEVGRSRADMEAFADCFDFTAIK